MDTLSNGFMGYKLYQFKWQSGGSSNDYENHVLVGVISSSCKHEVSL